MPAIHGDLVVGIFDRLRDAQQAVQELLNSGFSETDIGLLARHGDADTLVADSAPRVDVRPRTAEGVEAGAITGAGVGAALALVVATGVFPGVGTVMAAGLFAAYLAAGAAGGAVAGSVIGGLVGMGLAEHEGTYYEEAVHQGRILVTVHTATRQAKAVEVLTAHGAENIVPRVGSGGSQPPHLHLGESTGLVTPPGGMTPSGNLASATSQPSSFHMPSTEANPG